MGQTCNTCYTVYGTGIPVYIFHVPHKGPQFRTAAVPCEYVSSNNSSSFAPRSALKYSRRNDDYTPGSRNYVNSMIDYLLCGVLRLVLHVFSVFCVSSVLAGGQ